MHIPPISTYRNAIEPLVIQELEHQIAKLPQEMAQSIDGPEAIAYALNRLPALYATTEEGWQWHQDRARKSLASFISKAVSWGLHRAQNKNKKFFTPLNPK